MKRKKEEGYRLKMTKQREVFGPHETGMQKSQDKQRKMMEVGLAFWE